MNLEGQRVLVTGGAGFIGSHLVEALVEAGASVGVVDDFSAGKRSNIPESKRVQVHPGSVTDLYFVRKVVGGYDSILHGAARVSVNRSIEDPVGTNQVNLTGTLNLLIASRDTGVDRFVYASSSSVYGDTPTLPKDESMPLGPISPYAVSKMAGEAYCQVFASIYGLRTVSLRYFNVYGPRQVAGPYSGVIPAFIKRVLSGEPPLINGDGTQTRDFTYVKDVVQANLLCLQRTLQGGEVFNVGSHTRTSLNELAGLVCKLAGANNVSPLHGPARPGDILHSYADITKISSQLGYKPSYTIESGLTEVIDWFRSADGASLGS